MTDKPQGIDFFTKLTAENMQPLWDMVWDVLGGIPDRDQVRARLEAQPEAPDDGKIYVAQSGGWTEQDPQNLTSALAGKLELSGGTMTGNLLAPAISVSLEQQSWPSALTRKDYVDTKVAKTGDTMTGQLGLLSPAGNSNPTILGQFANLKSGNGYQKLPNGLVVQWGRNSTNSNGDGSIVFPIAFPNGCLMFVANFIGAAAAMITSSAWSATGASIHAWTAAGTGFATASGVGWIAIGH